MSRFRKILSVLCALRLLGPEFPPKSSCSKLRTRNHLRRRWPEVSGDVRKNEILVSHGPHAQAHRGCVEPLLKTRRLTLPTWDPRECQEMSQNVTEIESVPMRGRPVRGRCRGRNQGRASGQSGRINRISVEKQKLIITARVSWFSP